MTVTSPRASAPRWLELHLRARGVPATLAGVVAVAVLGWLVGEWLTGRPYLDGPRARPPVAALCPVLVAVMVSSTFSGADDELERSTPWRWRRVRLMHVIGGATGCATALAAVGLWEPQVYGAHELVRNTLACVGMVALAAVVVGSKLSWAPVFGYVLAVYLAAPKPIEAASAWWTWPMQPSAADLAWWVAIGWFLLGTAAFAWRGPRVDRVGE